MPLFITSIILVSLTFGLSPSSGWYMFVLVLVAIFGCCWHFADRANKIITIFNKIDLYFSGLTGASSLFSGLFMLLGLLVAMFLLFKFNATLGFIICGLLSLYGLYGEWQEKKEEQKFKRQQQEYEKRQQDYERGNYYGTFEHTKQSLMQNANTADYRKLGYMYENGYGTTQDYNKAMKCYQKANAWREIGYMHYFGYGVPKNKDKANEYFAKCDDRKDCEEVIEFFEDIERIARGEIYVWLGYSSKGAVLYNLGCYYAEGKGVCQDYQKALYYYNKAVDLGSREAYNNLGYMYSSGKGVERDYYTARRYFQKGADLGEEVACNNMGSCYENGWGGSVDKYKALKYYKKACNLGNQKGCENYERLKNEMGIINDDDVLF